MRRALTVAARELRSYFSTPIAYIFLVIYLIATQGFFFYLFFRIGEADLRLFFFWQPMFMLFLIPAITMRSWAEEKKVGTMELLMTLPAPDIEIVLGKFLASLIFWGIALALTVTLPWTVYRLAVEGIMVDSGPIIGGYVGLFLLGGVYIAVCLFASSLTENQIVAFIAGLAFCAVLLLIGSSVILYTVPEALVKPLQFIGLWANFENISRGIIDSRNVVYYLSVMAFFLFLNAGIVASRGWMRSIELKKKSRELLYSVLAVFLLWVIFLPILRSYSPVLHRSFALFLAVLFFGASISAISVLYAFSVERKVRELLIRAIALFVILAVINLFSYRHFVRWDLTANREFTVSQTTREMLGGLQNLINVKVYLSKSLPAELLTFERQLRDLLSEYEIYSKGKLRIEFIDPANTPETERELMIQGVRPQAVAVYKRDTTTQAQIFNSIVVQFESQREVISSLIDEVGRGRVGLIGDFEYLLTSRIFKCQRTGHQVIGWLTNDPKIDLNKDYKTSRDIVRREWDIRDVRFDQATQIPPDIAVLIVVSPRDFTDAQLFELDQFVMHGGKILALVETYNREYQRGALESLSAKPTNFTRLLETYGLKVNQDVVMDTYCARAPLGRVVGPYEFWVNIIPKGLNKEHPVVARLGKLTLPWTQSLDKSSSIPAGVEMVSLAQTSERSTVRWGERVTPNPRIQGAETSKIAKPRIVVAALSGIFPSCFREGTPYPTNPATTASAGIRTPESERKYSSVETRIVVVGNALFLQEDFLNISRLTWEGNQNVSFFLNAVEWLALGKGLGQIRSRQWESRPIRPQIPDWQRNTYKALGTFMMPTFVVVVGVLYNIIRRRRRGAIADRLLSE